MSIEEINESSADVPAEAAEINSTSAPLAPAEAAPEAPAVTTTKWGLNRRKFLTAAALGTAAATFLKKGSGGSGVSSWLSLGPASAFAHDISDFQCTSNDVRIIGKGQIINEPCTCTKTCSGPNGTYSCFDATVEFTVFNNAASARNCVTLHLCPVTVNGVLFDPGDVQLQGSIGGKETKTMQGTIQNYPCGSGLVCFGSTPASGVQGDVFAKGENCPTGQCCSTITWRVPGQDPDCDVEVKLIGSKCRHQQICIQGRGSTTLDCNTSTTAVDHNCTIACGSSTTIKACTSNASSLGPFKYELFLGSVACNTTNTPIATVNSTTDTCRSFNVGPLTATTSYTVRITDKDSCVKCDTVTLTVSQTPAPTISLTAGPDCSGNATVSVTNCDSSLTYTWYDGANVISGVTGCTLTKQFSTGSHSITVIASQSGSCPSPASNAVTFTVNPPVNTAVTTTDNGCDGSIVFDASGTTGGNGSYTFTFKLDGTTVQNNSTATYTYKPKLTGSGVLNTACHTITVQAFDTSSNTCAGDVETFNITQCITSTINTGACA